MKRKKHWYDYLWIASGLYLILGFFNILFAWLGLICFIVPLLISIFSGSKAYCNRYCGRGHLFELLGRKFNLSRNRNIPHWLRTKWFRYGFLTFFMIMFFNMLFSTWLVFSGARDLREVVTCPGYLNFHGTGQLPPQYHHGLHNLLSGFTVMLTSTLQA